MLKKAEQLIDFYTALHALFVADVKSGTDLDMIFKIAEVGNYFIWYSMILLTIMTVIKRFRSGKSACLARIP